MVCKVTRVCKLVSVHCMSPIMSEPTHYLLRFSCYTIAEPCPGCANIRCCLVVKISLSSFVSSAVTCSTKCMYICQHCRGCRNLLGGCSCDEQYSHGTPSIDDPAPDPANFHHHHNLLDTFPEDSSGRHFCEAMWYPKLLM